MNYIKPVLLLCFLAYFSAFTPLYADNFSDDSTGRDDAKAYQIYDDVYLISSIKLQYSRPRIVAKSVFPQLQTETLHDGVDTFNQTVSDLVKKEVTSFMHQVSLNQPFQKQLARAKVRNDLYIDYDTSVMSSGSNHLVSVRFSIQGFIAGMTHAYHYHRTLNYNLNDNLVIELGDLFNPNTNYLDVLSIYSRNILFRRLADKELVTKGTAPTPDNFQNWNMKPNGLLITFDESQVAPTIAGAQTVLVPYSALQDIISSESPLIGCINHRKRCAQNNLLTGGFIDEAINTPHRTLNPVLSKI